MCFWQYPIARPDTSDSIRYICCQTLTVWLWLGKCPRFKMLFLLFLFLWWKVHYNGNNVHIFIKTRFVWAPIMLIYVIVKPYVCSFWTVLQMTKYIWAECAWFVGQWAIGKRKPAVVHVLLTEVFSRQFIKVLWPSTDFNKSYYRVLISNAFQLQIILYWHFVEQ